MVSLAFAGGLAAPPLLRAAEIHDAISARDHAKVAQLLAASPDSVSNRTDSGATPLHIAAGLNDTNLVSLLLDKGADARTADTAGWTPLHVAAASNAVDVLALLFLGKIDLLARTASGYSPLRLAIAYGSVGAVEILVKRTSVAYDDPCLDARTITGTRARATNETASAFRILSDLMMQDPGNDKINFALGMVCCSLKDYARAQMAFDRVLLSSPANDRARVELANAYLAGGQPGLAIKEFEIVLARKPPPAVARSVESAMAQAQKSMTGWRYSLRIESGWLHDDNVNSGPDSATISIAPIVLGDSAISLLTVQDSSRPVKADGLYVAAGLSTTFDAGVRDAWLATADCSFYQSRFTAASDYEILVGQAAAGVKWLGARSEFAVPARVTSVNYGHDPLVNTFGLAPSHRFALGRSGDLQLFTSAACERRDYYRLDGRDGYSLNCSETVRKYIGKRGHNVSLGGALSYDRTRDDAYQGATVSGSAAGELTLPLQAAAYVRTRISHTAYDESETLAPERREDRQKQFSAGLNKKSGPWGVDISYQRTENESSFDLYEYKRNVVTFSVSASF